MSTRTNIHFSSAPGDIRANIYRHHDGYPSAVLPNLAEFFLEAGNLKDSRFGDPEYLAAKFLVWQAGQNSDGPGSLNFLGLGISTEDHGDIEYVYEVVCDGGWRNPAAPSVRWHACDGEWKTWRVGDPVPD